MDATSSEFLEVFKQACHTLNKNMEATPVTCNVFNSSKVSCEDCSFRLAPYKYRCCLTLYNPFYKDFLQSSDFKMFKEENPELFI